jgi:hypothetical protein
MKTRSKGLRRKFSALELIKLCNEKMIMAARDLAEFTKHGLYANFIVSLAQKCEEYEKAVSSSHSADKKKDPALVELENFLIQGLIQICEMGMAIWSENPERSRQYVLPEYLPTYINRSAA